MSRPIHSENNPKQCSCGEHAKVVDTRPGPNGWRRRYQCTCGGRWSTIEVKAEDRTPGNTPISIPTTETQIEEEKLKLLNNATLALLKAIENVNK